MERDRPREPVEVVDEVVAGGKTVWEVKVGKDRGRVCAKAGRHRGLTGHWGLRILKPVRQGRKSRLRLSIRRPARCAVRARMCVRSMQSNWVNWLRSLTRKDAAGAEHA